MSTEENKAILRKYVEDLGKGNIDAWGELISPGFVRHLGQGNTKSFADLEQSHGVAFREHGVTIAIDDMIAEGDRIAAWMTSKVGETDYHYCLIFRFSGGKVVEDWDMIAIQRDTPWAGNLSRPKE